MSAPQQSRRTLDWKLLLLHGCGGGFGALLGSLVHPGTWVAAIGGALGALVAGFVGRQVQKSS